MIRLLASLILSLLIVSAPVTVRAQDDSLATAQRPAQTLDGTDGRGMPLDLSMFTSSDAYRFEDYVTINFEVNREARVWIFSQDDSGEVRQLLPNAYNRDNRVKSGTLFRIPSARYDLKAGPPAGRRRITAIAIDARATDPTSQPRYDTRRPFPIISDPRGLRTKLARAAYEFDRRAGNREQFSYAESTRSIRFESGLGSVPHGWDPEPTPVPPGQADRYGKLNVTSSPARAEVYVEGRYYGRTPIDLQLRTGRYDIVIRAPGYETYTTTKEILRKDSSQLAVRLRPVTR